PGSICTTRIVAGVGVPQISAIYEADSGQFTGTASLPFVGGRFVSGGDGAFDPGAIVSAALQEARGMADGVAAQWPGNIAAQAGAGMTHRLIDAVIPAGANILSTVLATSMGAGSPEVVAAVRAVATKYGWGSGAQWDALYKLIQGESSWNPNAANPSSSARGLFQKMTSLHGPLEPTVAGQAEWGLSYIRGAYGDPLTAYTKWLSRSPHWYDQGGYLPRDPGTYTIAKGTTKPEAVLDPASTAAYIAHANALTGDGEVRLDQYSINRLAAAFATAISERPTNVQVQGLGVSVAGV
ncbi:IMP dehydrogenase, partial [Amycolatopsis sp. NPDC006131]|uniref:aggregation-promoting factor C-terminal-like domain-containing protein n=1 Tax=Amycolatopsis sp. NPDC006131 TaxID=3156731 RepID=UPI0033A942C6